jgi:hypothetical protein
MPVAATGSLNGTRYVSRIVNSRARKENAMTHAGRSVLLSLAIVSGPAFSGGLAGEPASLPRLKISDNCRFLIQADGSPFFYLGDTAWELFHRLNREEADRYLANRASKGFTVIQAVALAELDGLNTPNAYGHRPLIDNDPTKPDMKDGPANDYWDHVDYIVDQATARGLVIGLLPTWGDKWNKKWGVGGGSFTPQSAAAYGEWLGRRYKDKALIWILGGDRPIETDQHRDVIRAMARGLSQGDGGTHLKTFHPPGGNGSSTWWHDDDWLDFNMRQNGHVAEFTGRYDQTRADYDRTPIKPVLDGEPIYEDHPISFDPKKFGHSIAADVRRPLYWDLFGGACGHTYGHHSVWQMYDPQRGQPINNPLLPWYEALDQPGAGQMQHAKHLLLSRPFLTRVPDDTVIVTDRVPTSVPGAGRYRFAATRDESGSCAMVYAPAGRAFRVRMDKISGPTVKAWWFNPRTGEAKSIGEFPNTGEREFTPPDAGELLDWVLVLDDVTKKYPPPGTGQPKSPSSSSASGSTTANARQAPVPRSSSPNWPSTVPTSRCVTKLPAGQGPDDEQGLRPGRDSVGQGSVRRLVGQIPLAGEEPQERSALAGDVVADRPAQHRIAGLQRLEDRA